MEQKIILNLYKSVLISDFCILQNFFVRSIKRYIKVLNILEVLKILKFFIFELLLIKKNLKNIIYIGVEHFSYCSFLKNFLYLYPIKYKYNIYMTQVSVVPSSLKNTALSLNFANFNNTYLKSIFSQNIFLVNQIIMQKSVKNLGVYKMYNYLFDLKKLIFFFTLINKI